MFGRSLGEYLRFQKAVLVILAVVGVARLALSVAGLPNSTVKWLSMNAVTWAGAIYYGIAAHVRAFGGYKRLLPVALIHMLAFQAVACTGILLAIAGVPNIFAAPEYSFQVGSQWLHLLGHLTIGIAFPTMLLWGLSSLAMLVAKKAGSNPRPAVGQEG